MGGGAHFLMDRELPQADTQLREPHEGGRPYVHRRLRLLHATLFLTRYRDRNVFTMSTDMGR